MSRLLRLGVIFLLLFASSGAFAQIGYGTAKRVQFGVTLPPHCDPATGDVYFINAGLNIGLYECLATDTWYKGFVVTDATGLQIPGMIVVDGVNYSSIQTAVTAASTNGSVLISSRYTGTDSYTNSNHVPIIDMRNSSFQVNSFGRIRVANVFSGSDIGAMINAADTDLGASAGEIWAFPTGSTTVITTTIVVSSGHALRMFAGNYTNALGLRVPVVRLQDNSVLTCNGKQLCVIQESSNAANTTPVIVCAYDLGATCSTLGPSTNNIHVYNIHFQAANPNVGTSLIDSVSLGNCTQCSVKDNWFDLIKSSHVLVGGSSGSGFWSDGFEISGNNFTGSGNCSVCVINAQNLSIHDNFWSLHGNGAAADIDIEPNATTDHAQGIDIHDNNFDESLAIQTVFCVTMQNGQFVAMGRVKIHDNHCNGGPFTTFGNVGPTGTFKLTQCFGAGPGPVNTMSDVEIYNNDCRVTVQGGISLVGVNRGYIHDNIVQCANADAISLAGSVTNSTVERNTVLTVTSPNSCGQNTKGAYLSSIVSETNASNANNIFRDNIARTSVVTGAGSKVVSTDMLDGSGRSMGSGFGLEAGLTGSLKMLGVGQVTGVTSVGGAVSGCVLGPQQVWFYKVTAITAYGEGPASAEFSGTFGGGSGCPTFTWNRIVGASGYKLYRGATTGTEGLILTVSTGATLASDDGTVGAGAAPPSTDSTVVIGGVEGAPPSGVALSDLMWPDAASHCWKLVNNNGTPSCVAFTPTGTGYMHVTAGVLDAASATGLVSSLIDQQGPAAAVVGTGADATLFTKTISANTIAAGKCIDVIMAWAHTTGSAAVTYKLKLGSTTLVSAGPTNDTNVGSDITAHICNAAGVQNSQYFHIVTITGSATDTVFTTNGTSAENTANPLALTGTMSVAATDQVTPKFWKVSGDDSR